MSKEDYIYRYSKYPFQSDKRNFYYKTKKSQTINKLDNKMQKYVDDLKIPPAYHPVKIFLNPNSKILAIGDDKMGKKQYIYNPTWINRREKDKYCKLKIFAQKLPLIKTQIQKDLATPGMTKTRMIALILRIIFMCHFRIGNDIGIDLHNSYGISTITKKQISLTNKTAKIKFVGKSGVTNECLIKDRDTVDILHKLYKTPKTNGPLFSYSVAGQSEKVRINAKDVNGYLKTFGNFTTKYFRTWIANVTFIDQIMSHYTPGTELSLTARKKIFRDCIQLTAEQLYHTPAICKKSYVSKDLWNMFIENPEKFDQIIAQYYKANKTLDASENAFIHFLNDVC